MCQDIQHSVCISTIDRYLRYISNANYGATLGLQEDIINTFSALKYTFSCLQRKQRVVTTVSEHCQKGNGNFNTVYSQAVQDFFPNKDQCTGLADKDYTTRDAVLKQVQEIASRKGFYSRCELNSRAVLTKICIDSTTMAGNYDLPGYEKSRLVRDCKKILPGRMGSSKYALLF